jgi:hypothetical protein
MGRRLGKGKWNADDADTHGYPRITYFINFLISKNPEYYPRKFVLLV